MWFEYRTHYVSLTLTERKQQQLKEKLSRAAQPVVFQILRDSHCSECGAEIAQGSFLLMEAEQPLCLPCARLDHLEYLPSGDAALTRRATKYSGRTAVVVRFSRSRGRYERQGILVENAALERAEQECTLDADARATTRARAAVLRGEQDRELITRMTKAILDLFPAVRRMKRAPSLPTRRCVAADAQVVPPPAGILTSEPWSLPLPPRFVTITQITTSCWRAEWTARSLADRLPIGCRRFWRLGEGKPVQTLVVHAQRLPTRIEPSVLETVLRFLEGFDRAV